MIACSPRPRHASRRTLSRSTALARYQCRGLKWTEGEIKCAQCDLSLRELDLQITALPGEERRLRDQHRVVYRARDRTPTRSRYASNT